MKKLAITIISFMALGCGPKASVPEWVDTGKEVNENYGDVIWFTGSLFGGLKDDTGNTIYRISLSDGEKRVMHESAMYIMQHIFPDSLNFFCPYYHQFTLDSLHLPEKELDSLGNAIADEAYSCFHYYMQNVNGGRPYILAGMSQGAMMVRGILKRMTDVEYSGMKAAYSLGFGLSPEDLECDHIIPASGEFDKGVTVSFNSAVSHMGIWPFVYNNAQAVINPVNWRTDCMPARFITDRDTVTVQIDSVYNILILKGCNHYYHNDMSEPWVEDNRHLEDLLLYIPFLKRNALDRMYQ